MILNNRGVTLNGTNLETAIPGLQITYLPDREPSRSISSSTLARQDKSVVSSAFYTSRKINIQCEISRPDRASLEDSLDTLRALLSPKEQTLVVPYGSSFRQYTVTFDNLSKTNQAGGYVELDIEFTCSDSMGYSKDTYILIAATKFTSRSNSFSFITAGSAEWQYPYFRAVFVAVSGGSSKNVEVGNHDTGQGISITRDWSADDVLEFGRDPSTGEQIVRINGVDADFTGAIPVFKTGSGQLDYSDAFTSGTVEMWSYYQKRYI